MPGFFRTNVRQVFFGKDSVWTLADGKWRAATPGLNPLRLPRARRRGNIVIWSFPVGIAPDVKVT